jgi:DNA-binding response OmpR family regulator
MRKSHVVIAEDDRLSLDLMTYVIDQIGNLRTSKVETGSALLELLAKDPVDLVVLDLELPDENGIALARQIRARSDVPIFVVTSEAGQAARLVALELGVDDFVTKPFDVRELKLRIRNMLRRTQDNGRPAALAETRLQVADFILSTSGRSLIGSDGIAVPLTANEALVLGALARRPGQTMSRGALLDAIGKGADGPGDRAIDIYVKNLREKLGDDARSPYIIHSVRGVGYRLGEASANSKKPQPNSAAIV